MAFLGIWPPSAQALPLVLCVPGQPASLPTVLKEEQPKIELDSPRDEAIKLFVLNLTVHSARIHMVQE